MRVPKNVVQSRRLLLADLLQNQRYLPLDQICSRLSISAATARRDLSELEADGENSQNPPVEPYPTFRINFRALRSDWERIQTGRMGWPGKFCPIYFQGRRFISTEEQLLLRWLGFCLRQKFLDSRS